MRISVVVPAYNCAPYLRRAIESLVATQYEHLEIVIVDDGSTDGTLELAHQLHNEHPQLVQVLRHPRGINRGVSATRNRGMQGSTGELIAFLDADDYVFPWRFQSAVDQLRTDAEIDAVHQVCQIELTEEKSTQFWREGNLLFGFQTPISSDEILYQLLRGFCWSTSAVLFRRELLSKTGLFDARLRVCEDCHFWMRMAVCGRVVPGDLSRPVSVYWRRPNSAFQYSPWQRLKMIRAMSSFHKWMRRRDANDPRLPRVAQSISNYILTGVEEAHRKGQRRLAWYLASQAPVYFPRVCRERRFYGQLARMATGR